MSRTELLEYAAERGLPLPVVPGRDAPSSPPVADAAAPHPGEAAVVDITFKAGLPVALNGVAMPLLDLIGSLDFLAGKNGVGRCEQFETPAVSVLAPAHNELQQRVSTGEMDGFSRTVGRQYADLVENGGWFSLLRAALDAYVDRAQQVVNGVVRVKLHEGACEIVQSHVSDGQENDDNVVVGPLRYRA